MTFKDQIDLWTVVHFFGPIAINIVLILLNVNNIISYYISIFCVACWEFFDFTYNFMAYWKFPIYVKYNWLLRIFDKRGTSYVDYIVGAIGLILINLFNSKFEIVFTTNELIITLIYTVFIFILFFNNKIIKNNCELLIES